MTICQVTKLFDNSMSVCVELYSVKDNLMERFLRATNGLFRGMDRQDEQQISLSRSVWILRATVLYTVKPFSSPELRLTELIETVKKNASGYPDLRNSVTSVVDASFALLKRQENNKRSLLLERAREIEGEICLITRMTAGAGIGWVDKTQREFTDSELVIPVINSAAELSAPTSHIFIPGGLGTVPLELVRKVFFGGMCESISVFCYQGESFKPPSRFSMQNLNLLAQVRDVPVRKHFFEVGIHDGVEDLEGWMTEQFWVGLHGGDREGHSGNKPARYVLFGNGTGCCLPEDGSVLTTRHLSRDVTARDFSNVNVSRLASGDWIILRVGSGGTHLDETSDRLLEERGEEGLLERATDWKQALDAMTLTKSFLEISEGLERFGCKVSGQTIQQWLSEQVLGPASQEVFETLIRYLYAENKIALPDSELEGYISSRWKLLQEFRGLRHRAGNIIRRELIDRLIEMIQASGANNAHSDEFRISSDESSSMVLLRIELIDSKPCYVPPSRFGQLDDLRSSRWLV